MEGLEVLINFGIFGVPMVGSDMCSFFLENTEELCNRWIEVGAFYPFSRDHAENYSPRQELYLWESVTESARNALGMRYKLLPYLYTLNYEAHISGDPIARPQYPFVAWSSLMISPILEQVKALLPPTTWYNLFDLRHAIMSKDGIYVTLDAPLYVINVHLYQNTILPTQQGGMLTKDDRMTSFSPIVTFTAGATEGEAKWNLFLDDDELPEMKLGSGYSTYIDFHATVKERTVEVWSKVQESKFALDKGWVIHTINVLGLNGNGELPTVMIDGEPLMCVSHVKVYTSEHKYFEQARAWRKEDSDGRVERLEYPYK